MPLPIDPAEATALVHDDVRAAFATAFPGDVSTPEPFEPDQRIASDATVVVPWRWTGHHDEPFLDVPATGVDVEILGVTLLREDGEGGVVHHRLVDWLGLYQQLGVVIGSAWTLDRSTKLARSSAP